MQKTSLEDAGTKIAGISIRRVNQIYKEYLETEKIPEMVYEIRPHRALKFDILETPEQAFIRKMRGN